MARVGDDRAFRWANHRKEFAMNRELAMQRHRSVPLLLVALLAMVGAALPMSPAAAQPTAGFTFGPAEPSVGEPVTFDFTGSCDIEPCRIVWTWFRTGGGDRLGTKMGEGESVKYTFTDSGSHTVVARITNRTGTNGMAKAQQGVVVRATYQDDAPAVRYGRWQTVETPAASQGRHATASGRTASAVLAFRGTKVTYVGRTGADEGIADVRVDGARVGTVDLYSAEPGTLSQMVTGLAPGRHKITIRPTDTANPDSTGTAVSVDEFVLGSTRVDDSAPRVTYSTWAGGRFAEADGGSMRFSSHRGARAALTFTGTSLTWLTQTGPAQGMATVQIDGRVVADVDNYAEVRTFQTARTFSRLAPGRHTVEITVDGARNAASTGNRVVVDSLVAR